MPSLQKAVLWFAASAVMLRASVSDELQGAWDLQTQKLSQDGIQWCREFTVTNAKVMYAGRNYFDYINVNKNIAITVLIPENALLLTGSLAGIPHISWLYVFKQRKCKDNIERNIQKNWENFNAGVCTSDIF